MRAVKPTDGFNLSAFNFHFEKGVIRAQVTSVLYKDPSFSHTWKSTRKAPPHKPPKRTNAYHHNKLCINYAKRKSFTESSVIVLSIQSIVTNCKGIAMEASSQTMNVKRNVNTFSDLTWCLMRKGTCTNNELGEFLVILGIGKRTGHSTLKNAKEKASPTIPLPKYKQYNTTRQSLELQLSKLQLPSGGTTFWLNTIQIGNLFPEEAFKYHRPEREGFLL